MSKTQSPRTQSHLVTRLIRVAVAGLALGLAGLIVGVILYLVDVTEATTWMFAALVTITVGMGCLAGAEGMRGDAGSEYPRRE